MIGKLSSPVRREAERKRASTLAPRRSADPSGWITRRRRCVRDYERLPEHHEAIVTWSMIILMSRRLARTRK
ncbi:hypothetical protein GCM10027089_41300 [Nocardia thraciensis]